MFANTLEKCIRYTNIHLSSLLNKFTFLYSIRIRNITRTQIRELFEKARYRAPNTVQTYIKADSLRTNISPREASPCSTTNIPPDALRRIDDCRRWVAGTRTCKVSRFSWYARRPRTTRPPAWRTLSNIASGLICARAWRGASSPSVCAVARVCVTHCRKTSPRWLDSFRRTTDLPHTTVVVSLAPGAESV